MGLPSLLEDIVQRRIDNFLEQSVDSGRFYTREDFKRAVSQIGINARDLLSVDDAELVEISEEFAKETQSLRKANSQLTNELANAKARIGEISKERDLEKQRVVDRKAVIDRMAEENKRANVQIDRLRKNLKARETELSAHKSEKADLKERLSQCQAEMVSLNKLVMQKLVSD